MREQAYVIEIKFKDRFGLGFEIFEVFKNMQVNLLATEAYAQEGMAIKFAPVNSEQLEALLKSLREISGVISIDFRQHLQAEQREHELRTILNSVSEGVIAINEQGVITHINEVACTTLQFSRAEVLGKQITEILGEKTPLQEILETGKECALKEVKISKEQRIIHFFTSGVPIIDQNGNLIGAVATIKDYRRLEEIISKVSKKGLTTFDDIIYQSSSMQKVVDRAKAVAKGSSTVLLRGESGTGKELFARAIHMESNRSHAAFIAINCGALPDSLLESELFGYEEGAFTGGIKGGKKGLFEQANGGTLFLDEVGEISPRVQVRLLRVLQEGTIRRVGGTKEFNVDVRIVAATHRNLEEMIQLNQFREDLYYRLNVIPLRIPPLRERLEDIPLIAQHLVRKICLKLNRLDVSLSQPSLQFLMSTDWRGNVRQLENLLERVLNIVDTVHIRPEDFAEWLTWPQDTERVLKNVRGQNAVAQFGQVTLSRPPAEEQADMLTIQIALNNGSLPLKPMLKQIEQQILQAVLEKHPSSRKAGKVLGVSGTTILNKLSGNCGPTNQLKENP